MSFGSDKVRFFTKNKKVVFLLTGTTVLLFGLSFSTALASPPTSPYNPGETLDPGCAPLTANCTVNTSIAGLGTSTQIAFYNGTGTVISDSNLTWSSSTALFFVNGSVSSTYGRFNVATSTGLSFVNATGTNLYATTLVSSTVFKVGGGGLATAPAYTFAYDNDDGMFQPVDDTLGFSTNGAIRLLIDSNGTTSFYGNVTSSNLTVTNTVSSTNAFHALATTTGLSFQNATGTNLYATTLVSSTNFFFTNATGTSLTLSGSSTVSYLNFINATGTLVSSTNSFHTYATATNLWFTNATGTTLFLTNASSTNGSSTNFFFTNATGTTLFLTNASTTNGSTTYLNFTNATGTSLTLSASSTVKYLNFTNATGTAVSTTNAWFTYGTGTQLTLSASGTPALTFSGAPQALSTNALLAFGAVGIAGGNTSGTVIGINYPSSTGVDFINFQMSSTPMFRVASSGLMTAASVLVGTTTLPVSGALFSVATTSNIFTVLNTNNVLIGTTTAVNTTALFSVATTSNNLFTVFNTGKIGIGTTTPAYAMVLGNGTGTQSDFYIASGALCVNN